jgi:ankyrin repeat protein
MLAAQNGHTEALALLLASGANVNAALQVIQNIYLL